MRWKFGVVAAGYAVTVALSAGCAPGGSDDGKRLPESTVESFRLLMYQPREVVLAEHRLIQRCMRAHGFEYPARVPDTGRPARSLLQVPPPFTVDRAREDGYGTTIQRVAGTRSVDPGNPVEHYVASLSVADQVRFRRAMDDDSLGKVTVSLPGGGRVATSSRGCRGEARLKTYGSLENYLTITYLPQMAQTQVVKVESDRELLKAMKKYAGCMRDGGYQVDTPTAAAALAESYYASGTSPQPRQQEITLAVKDANCQEQTRVYHVYQDTVNRLAAKWIAEHEAEVLAAADAQRAAHDNAAKVLREGS